MQLVREFFELNLFHVLTHWQHAELVPRGADPASLLFVEHASPAAQPAPEFLLRPEDLPAIERAVVEVRAWHGDRFYASTIESNPVFGHLVSDETRALADSVFGGAPHVSILIISELPVSAEPRERAVQQLRNLGIGHLLEFPTLLADMLERIHPQGNYAPSQTLQMMRILKRYHLIRRQQLEFSFAADAPEPAVPPSVDTATAPEPPEDDA